MMFRITGLTIEQHEYSVNSEQLFDKLFSNISNTYSNEVMRLTGKYILALENKALAFNLLKSNVPQVDFISNPKNYILLVLNYIQKRN